MCELNFVVSSLQCNHIHSNEQYVMFVVAHIALDYNLTLSYEKLNALVMQITSYGKFNSKLETH